MSHSPTKHVYADSEGNFLESDDPNALPHIDQPRRKLFDGIVTEEERKERGDRERLNMFGAVASFSAFAARSRADDGGKE